MVIATTAVAAFISFLGVSVASADEIDPQVADEKYGIGPTLDLDMDPSSGLAQGSVIQGGISTLATTFSPAGCYGQTDYPHKSGSEASVHGRTHCSAIVNTVTVTTTLKRDRWYGEQTLATGTSSRGGAASNDSGTATPHWVCVGTGTYSYRGYSQHQSVESSGTYVASTSNFYEPVSRFTC